LSAKKSRRLSWLRGSGVMGLSLAFGVAAAGIYGDARALGAAVAPTPPTYWCVLARDAGGQPACYESLAACLVAAFSHASACTQVPRPVAAVARLAPARGHTSPPHHKLTATERDELFREFQQWQSTHEGVADKPATR